MSSAFLSSSSPASTINKPESYTFSITTLVLFLFPIIASPIDLVEMIPLPSQGSNAPIAMYNQSNTQSPYNTTFIEVSSPYNCSLSILYTVQQTQSELQQNSPYNITIFNVTQNTSVSITSVYKVISPTVDNSTQILLSPHDVIILQVRNGCPTKTNFFSYFDRVQLNVQGLQQFSYSVLCNAQFKSNTFEAGLLIIIFLSTILISVLAVYSKAWSIGGVGFTINILFIIIFGLILIVGGIVAAFSIQVVNVTVEVLSWIFGTISVALCVNEILFLIKLDFLKKGFKVKGFDIRIMQGISLVLGLGCCFGWYFSEKNWIVNDVVAICMIVASIKLFKITSLKLAIFGFASVLVIQIAFILVLQLLVKVSYNNAILNLFNNPFEVQAPTINAVYNQKCSWIPITAIAYPGAIMAYMRRFDTSRNTNVYLITCSLTFFIGSVIWVFISIGSPFSIPFGLLAEPAMCGLIALFAWKRKQIRTLWTGKFYDEQYANKQALKNITEMIGQEKETRQVSMKNSLFQGLFIADDQSCMQGSEMGQRRNGKSVQPPVSQKTQEQQQQQEKKEQKKQSSKSNY